MAIGRHRDRPARAPRDPPLHQRRVLRICGVAAVRALFERDPGRIERLFYDDSVTGQIGPLCRILAQARKPYRQVNKAELVRIAGTPLHGGVVAVARPRPLAGLVPEEAREWAKSGQPLLILDRVGNPHNLGAIVRSAAFFGLERIILADHPGQALPSDASYRVAEGGFEHLTLYRAPLPAVLDRLRPSYRIIGTAFGRHAIPDRWGSVRPIALVLGNEETGLDPGTIAACDDVVTIPGGGRIQSLSVAAAAAILLYTLTRS